jgi:2-octaprenyl-6-methoxyphenol hydroxylase
MPDATLHDVIVIGAGPAGLVAALGIARLGLNVAIVAPSAPHGDARTTALLGGSIDLMSNLDIWPGLADHAEALTGIRIVDDRGGFFRAPDVLFRAQEIGVARFGFNIANAALVSALTACVAITPKIQSLFGQGVTRIDIEATRAILTLGDGRQLLGRLVVGADGRHSIARLTSGVKSNTWSYPQSALVTTFAHATSHAGVSTEFHRGGGPLTTVPLRTAANGHASSLVWVDQPDVVAQMHALDDPAFARALDDRLHGLLGRISAVTPRAQFPLSGLSTDAAAGNRIALVGEAAHVIPPIGAQGLNLGFRDAAALADCVSDGLAAGEPLGGEAMLQRFIAARQADTQARVTAIDMLNRSLLTDFLPVQAMRGIGLHLLANSATLRQRAIHAGLEPVGERPRLMRPAAGPVTL